GCSDWGICAVPYSSFVKLRRLPRPPIFPYTTLFRSDQIAQHHDREQFRLQVPVGGPGRKGRPRAARDGVSVCFRGRLPLHEHGRSEEHTSELQSRSDLVCRLLLEKKKYRDSGGLSSL